MHAQITVHDKSMGMKDYHLYNKNGLAFYVFRKFQGVWQLASVINPFVYDLETQYANIRPGSSLGFNGYCSRKYKKQ